MSFNGPYSSEPNEWPTQDISSQANRPYDMSENSLPQNTILGPVFPLEGDRCGCFGIAYTENERLFIDESPNTMINCNCGYYEYIDPNDVPHPSQVPMDLANTAAIHEDSRIAKEDPKYTPDIYGSKPISSTGYSAYSFHVERGDTFATDSLNGSPKSTPSDKKKPNHDCEATRPHPQKPTTRNRFDCPHRDCLRTGENGFTRKDNLTQHRRNVHEEQIQKKKFSRRTNPKEEMFTKKDQEREVGMGSKLFSLDQHAGGL